MWTKITWALAALALPAIQTVHLTPKPEILIQSDSRSDPSGTCCGGPKNTWPHILQQISPFFRNATIVNLAVNGSTTVDLLKQIDTGAVPKAAGSPAYAFVWIGVVDAARGANGQTIYDHAREIWAKDRALGYKVVAFTVGPFCTNPEATARIAEADRLIEADRGDYDYLARPLECQSASQGASETKDGIHPNATGEANIAQTVRQLFVRNGLAPPE